MASSNLDIQIKAIVQGLQQIQQLSDSLALIDTTAQRVSTGLRAMGAAAAATVAQIAQSATAITSLSTSITAAATSAAAAATSITQLGTSATAAAAAANAAGAGISQTGTSATAAGAAATAAAAGITQLGTAATAAGTASTAAAAGVTNLGVSATATATALASAGTSIQAMVAAMGSAAASAQTLTATLTAAAAASQNMGAGATSGGSGMKGLKDQMDGVGDGANKLAGYLKGAVLAFVGLAAIKGVKELADYAASVETLGITLGIVAKNAGYTDEAISGYEKEIKKMGITTEKARESMSAMIQAGLPLGPSLNASGVAAAGAASNVSKLARAAQDLAVVSGQNSSETLARMITNIQQMDTLGLRFMGITVDISEAQEVFATSIGKSAASLTQKQKVMAVNNAVLREAAKLEGAYEASLETVGKKVQSMTRYQQELADHMGQKLLPAYAQLVDAATLFMKSLDGMVASMDANKELSRSFGNEVGQLSRSISSTLLIIAKFVADNESLFASLATNLVGIISDFAKYVGKVVLVMESMGVLKVAIWAVSYAVASFRDGMNTIYAVVLLAAGGVYKLAAAIAETAAAAAKKAGFDSLAKGLSDTASGFRAAGAEATSSGKAIVNGMLAGNTAANELATGVKSVTVSLGDFGKGADFKSIIGDMNTLTAAVDTQTLSIGEVGKAQEIIQKEMLAAIRTGKLSADQTDELLDKARQLSIELPKGFSNSIEVARTLAAEAKAVKQEMLEIGKSTTFKGIEKEIMSVTLALGQQHISSVEAAAKMKILEASVAKFAATSPAAANEAKKLTHSIEAIGTTIKADFAKNMGELGITVGELTTGINNKFSAMATNLAAVAGSAEMTGIAFTAAFSKELGTAKATQDVALLANALREAELKAKAFADAGNMEGWIEWMGRAAEGAKEATIKFDALFDTDAKAIKSEDDIRRLKKSVTDFAEKTHQSAEWVKEKMGEIGIAAGKAADSIANSKMDAAFAKIGISSEEAMGKASKAMDLPLQGLRQLITQSEVTGTAFNKAFEKGIDTAKAAADLDGLKQVLEKALKAGKINAAEYNEEIGKLGAKAEELFTRKLSAARTTEEFKALTKETQAMGAAGVISGTQMANELTRIREKASNAADNIKKISDAQTVAAQNMAAHAQTEVGIHKQDLDIQAAKVQLQETIAIAAKSGTAEAQQQVVAEKANLALLEAKKVVMTAQYALQIAGEKEVAAQKAVTSAEDEAARKPGDASALERVRLAKEQADAAALVTNEAKQTVAAGQANEATLQKQVDTENSLAAAANKSAEAKKKSAADGEVAWQSFLTQLANATTAINNSKASMEELGYSSSEAALIHERAWGSAFAPTSDFGQAMYQVGESLTFLQKKAADFREGMAGATKFSKDFNDAAASSKSVAEGLDTINLGLNEWNHGIEAVNKAYHEVKMKAYEINKAAIDASANFMKSVASIHNELLTAQGDIEGAAKYAFEQRKNDLKLEHAILDIKMRAAEITAKAAGIDTTALMNSRREAEAAYQQAQDDLNTLWEIQKANRKRDADEANANASKQRADAEQERRQEQQQNQQARQREQDSRPTPRINPDLTDPKWQEFLGGLKASGKQLPGLATGTNYVPEDMVAQLHRGEAVVPREYNPDAGGFSKGAQAPRVSEVIQLDLNVGGNKVSTYADKGDQDKLMNALAAARRVN